MSSTPGRARYASSLHASLEANIIPVEVFHNLIEVFKHNLPTWHRYWRAAQASALGWSSFTSTTSKPR